MIFSGSKKRLTELDAQNKKLQEENARLRAALEFYSNGNNWSEGLKTRKGEDVTITERRRSAAELDKGATALKALRSS
jgi:hypothetical protein